jgi:hypothetical protein
LFRRPKLTLSCSAEGKKVDIGIEQIKVIRAIGALKLVFVLKS